MQQNMIIRIDTGMKKDVKYASAGSTNCEVPKLEGLVIAP
jgi:hypothetical protein